MKFDTYVLFQWRPSWHRPLWLPIYVGYGPLQVSSRASALRIARTLMRDDVACPVVVVGVDELPETSGACGELMRRLADRLPAVGGDVDFWTCGVADGREGRPADPATRDFPAHLDSE